MTESERLKSVIEAIKAIKKYETQAPIAEKIGKNPNYFSGILNGKETVSDNLLFLLNLAFGVNKDYIRTGKGNVFDIEVQEDGLGKGANSDQRDLTQKPSLQPLDKHQDLLLQKIEQIEKSVAGLRKDTDKILLHLAQSKTGGIGGKKGKALGKEQ